MPSSPVSWYVRFPNGKVVIAKSTQAVRYHIERGRIPANSRIRRSAEEKWQPIDSVAEFADLLAPPSGPEPSSTDDREPTPNERATLGRSNVEYRVFGVASLVNELFSAVDLSLHHQKLRLAALAALVWAVGLVALNLVVELAHGVWLFGLCAAIAAVMLFVAGLMTTILAKMTLTEMLRRRHAEWHEIRPRLLRTACYFLVSEVLFLSVTLLPLQWLIHFDEVWRYFFHETAPSPVLKSVVESLRLILFILFPLLQGLFLLMGPVLVVEECTPGPAFGMWWNLLSADLSRIFLYETLALALGAILSLPLIFPVLYAGWIQGRPADRFLVEVWQATLHVMGGVAVTPFVAYLVVANVFIYLNMRYEFYLPNNR